MLYSNSLRLWTSETAVTMSHGLKDYQSASARDRVLFFPNPLRVSSKGSLSMEKFALPRWVEEAARG